MYGMKKNIFCEKYLVSSLEKFHVDRSGVDDLSGGWIGVKKVANITYETCLATFFVGKLIFLIFKKFIFKKIFTIF